MWIALEAGRLGAGRLYLILFRLEVRINIKGAAIIFHFEISFLKLFFFTMTAKNPDNLALYLKYA